MNITPDDIFTGKYIGPIDDPLIQKICIMLRLFIISKMELENLEDFLEMNDIKEIREAMKDMSVMEDYINAKT